MLVLFLWKPPISGDCLHLWTPFRWVCAGFSCLGDLPKSRILLNVPPIFYFITPFLNFSGVQREREKKNLFKRNLRLKSQIPPFLQFSREKYTPALPEIQGTRIALIFGQAMLKYSGNWPQPPPPPKRIRSWWCTPMNLWIMTMREDRNLRIRIFLRPQFYGHAFIKQTQEITVAKS